ncbi:MAG TPA: PAS domain S-box protein, partial [Planctomycetaceae bacterium]|nr:PAS domain S-box protein [Planctomycetaceae bacterium]
MPTNRPPADSELVSGGDGAPATERSSAPSETDEWFRLVLSNEADAILLVDGENGRIIEVNDAATRLYGYTRNEVLARTLFELVVDPIPPAELLNAEGCPVPGRIPVRRHRRKSGEAFPAEVSAGASVVNGRRLVCKIIRDVSERELTRQALVESERHFRAIADYTYDWESWHGPDGRLIWTNPAVERLTGYTAAECARMADYPLPMVEEGDRRRMAELYRGAAVGTSGNDVEFRLRRPNGALCWMAVSWQPIYDHAGGHMGFRTSVRDIAERKQLEERIRRHAEELEVLVEERTAQIRVLEQRRTEVEKLAALGRLAVGVAHEVNNPLAGIRNAFELIKSGLAPEHPYYDYIDLIDAEIERISS